MRLEGDSTPKPPAVARYSAWTGPLVESTLSSSGPSLCQVFRIQRPSASQKRRRNRKNARRGRSGGRENALAEALSCAGQANWNLWGSGLPPPPPRGRGLRVRKQKVGPRRRDWAGWGVGDEDSRARQACRASQSGWWGGTSPSNAGYNDPFPSREGSV